MRLCEYKAPRWFLDHFLAKNAPSVLAKIPKKRFKFMRDEPTRIEPVDLGKFAPTKFQVFFKRDDLNHELVYLQGNKLRKLEFLFAEAAEQAAQSGGGRAHVLTAGGLQSNHARAVAGLARQLGMKAHLFLRSDSSKLADLRHNGNLLVDRLLGADVYLIEKRAQYAADIEHKMRHLAERLRREHGPSTSVYLIPIGGSNTTGLFGYIDAFDELISTQKIGEYIDDIVVTSGSGGSMAGLAIANFMTGSRFKLHSFCVCDNSNYFYAHLQEQLVDLFGREQVEAHSLSARSMVNIVECSRGLGYGRATQDELSFQLRFMQETGILVDPTYTGKSLYALVNLLGGRRPTLGYDRDERAAGFLSSLQGRRILFIHTGGQLGQFAHELYESTLQTDGLESAVHNWFNDNFEKE